MTISLLHFQNFVLHNILLVKDILNHTNQLGFLSGRDSIYTLSAFEGDVVSCDTITDSTDIPKKIQKVLLVGAATLARLHKSGVAHGDAQIKNTAFSVKTGEERAIDLTSSYFDKNGRGITDDMHSYIDTYLITLVHHWIISISRNILLIHTYL